jgi:phosphoglycolate phosphatase
LNRWIWIAYAVKPELLSRGREALGRSGSAAMARYQHIIWDWNGTLLDDIELCIDVMNGMLRAREMPQIDTQTYREIFDFPVTNYYQALGFDFTIEPFEVLANSYCDTYDRRVPESSLQAGVASALGLLAESLPRQSILSSCEQVALTGAIESFGLAGRFAEVIGQSNRYASGKMQAGRALISSSRIPRSRTVLVGDTLHDHEVAQALEIDCILVANGHHSRQRLETVCDLVVDSLDTVVTYAV